MSGRTLDNQKDEVLTYLANHSQRKTATHFGIARSTLRDTLTAWAQEGTDTRPSEAISREEILEAELKEIKSQYRKARTLDVQAERIIQTIEEGISRAVPSYTPPSFDSQRPAAAHTHVLLLSDLHGGERVDPEAINGLNEYSWEIMQERMARIHRSLLSFKHNRPYDIDELHMWWLGDMVSGVIHDELRATNQYPIAEQAVGMGHLLGRWTEPLVGEYGRVILTGVPGNHPRITVKPQAKQVFDNFDWVAYKIAEAYLSNYESVETNFPRGGFAISEPVGRPFLLFHGDGIRSTMPGVPWGGVIRRTNELRKQYLERNVRLAGFALGHFHQTNAMGQQIFMNGSVKGTDEWVQKNFGSSEPPTQLLLTFHKEKQRITDVNYINP